jgi:hypothetical protein
MTPDRPAVEAAVVVVGVAASAIFSRRFKTRDKLAPCFGGHWMVQKRFIFVLAR